MEAREIIEFIGNAEKKTPVKVYVNEKETVLEWLQREWLVLSCS